MIGIGLLEAGANLVLGHAIDVADEIVFALGLDIDAVKPVDMVDNDVAGAACGAHRNVDHRLHESVLKSGW